MRFLLKIFFHLAVKWTLIPHCSCIGYSCQPSTNSEKLSCYLTVGIKHDSSQLLKSNQIQFLVFKTVVLQLLFHEETLEKWGCTIFQNNLSEMWEFSPNRCHNIARMCLFSEQWENLSIMEQWKNYYMGMHNPLRIHTVTLCGNETLSTP